MCQNHMYKGKSFAKGFYPLFRILRRTFSVVSPRSSAHTEGMYAISTPPPTPIPFFFTCFSNRHPPQYILTGTRLPLSKTMSRACIYVQAPQQAIDISLIGLSFNIHELPPSYQIYFDWRKSLFD